MLIHTMSWLPAGSAAVFIGENTTPVKVLDAYNQEWRELDKRYTIQVFTDWEDTALRVPDGDTVVRLRCTGNSSAPEDYGQGATSRNLFQLHGALLV